MLPLLLVGHQNVNCGLLSQSSESWDCKIKFNPEPGAIEPPSHPSIARAPLDVDTELASGLSRGTFHPFLAPAAINHDPWNGESTLAAHRGNKTSLADFSPLVWEEKAGDDVGQHPTQAPQDV